LISTGRKVGDGLAWLVGGWNRRGLRHGIFHDASAKFFFAESRLANHAFHKEGIKLSFPDIDGYYFALALPRLDYRRIVRSASKANGVGPTDGKEYGSQGSRRVVVFRGA
jgi:hypothetical protein